MQIYGPSQLHGAQSIQGPHTNRVAQSQPGERTASTGDQLDISSAGLLAARLNDVPEIRQDRVDALRAAIADGSYETADKLDAALERLLDEIG